MPGLIIDNKEIIIPGLEIVNFWDEPAYTLRGPEDMRIRHTRWIRSIWVHNTKNIRTKVRPGKGRDTKIERKIIKFWCMDERHAGAHLTVDHDGSIGNHCDLLRIAAYHASIMNEVSIGIEIYEDSRGWVYEYQLEKVCQLIDALTEIFRIQRQIPIVWKYDDSVIYRAERGGENLIGVFGHCHVTDSKRYDPGLDIFHALERRGYLPLNFHAHADLKLWKERQHKLFCVPIHDCDGVPGPVTCDGLQALGYKNGIWRPAEDPAQ